MNHNLTILISLCTASVCLFAGRLVAQEQEDSLVGKQVIGKLNINRPAERVQLRIANRSVGPLDAVNWPATVENVQDDWVWIDDGVSRGWVRSRHLQTLDQALAEANQALRTNPRAVAYEYRGIVRDAQGEHQLAIQDYTAAIRLTARRRGVTGDEQSVPYYNRGETYLKLGQHDAAIEDITRAIALARNRDVLAVYHQKRGEAWTAKNDTARAAADFQRSRQLKTR